MSSGTLRHIIALSGPSLQCRTFAQQVLQTLHNLEEAVIASRLSSICHTHRLWIEQQVDPISCYLQESIRKLASNTSPYASLNCAAHKCTRFTHSTSQNVPIFISSAASKPSISSSLISLDQQGSADNRGAILTTRYAIAIIAAAMLRTRSSCSSSSFFCLVPFSIYVFDSI